LHHNGPRRIEVGVHVDGVGTIDVHRCWQASDDLNVGEALARRPGDPTDVPVRALGLDAALGTWRPFLSYNELGGLLEDGPSKLYDAISSVLGLEEWVAAEQRLQAAHKDLTKQLKDSDTKARQIRGAAEPLDDERARAVVKAVPKTKPPLVEELRTLASGAAPSEAFLRGLEALAAITPLDLDEVGARIAALEAAAAEVAALTGSDADRARRQADLLGAALDWHTQHADDRTCPVCATPAVLDEAWATQARSEMEHLRQLADRATAANAELRQAAAAAERLLSPAPSMLHDGELGTVEALREPIDALIHVWGRWSAGSEAADADHAVLVAHLTELGPELGVALEAVREAAGAELRRRQDLWQPIAEQLQTWLPAALELEPQRPLVDALKEGERWLQAEANAVRNERLEPIADEVINRWETMRHSSNVTIERIALTGARNRRELDIKVSVDGVDGAGVQVMSQGELNALALSLFLPRATLAASPFRFLVIDEPVQAMDAARVDGLARNLHEVAKRRQVIVFTHDERLPDACRRLGLEATVYEVHRAERSAVTVRRTKPPALLYLDDARAVLKTEGYPAEALERVVPGLCRNAIEASCADVAHRRLLAAGLGAEDIERQVEGATSLRHKLALALFGDAGRHTDVAGHVTRKWGRPMAEIISTVNKGSHEHITRDAHGIVQDSAALVGHVLKLDGTR
ncbi:MAG: hypothetical protein AB7W59_29540, partial [Acidimicrobiia bacterium]